MAVLNKYIKKKLKASSLVETLVATIIIVLMFSIATIILNKVFKNSITNNTDDIQTEIDILNYKYLNNQISIPYNTSYNKWEISIQKQQESTIQYIVFNAQNKETKKTVTKRVIDEFN